MTKSLLLFVTLSFALTSLACPISNVWQIKLNEEGGVPKNIAEQLWQQIQKNDQVSSPNAYLFNQEQSEGLKLTFHPGNDKYTYSEFVLEKNNSKNKNALVVEAKHLSAGPLKLGMKKSEVWNKLNVSIWSQVNNNDEQIFVYQDRNVASNCLKKAGMPLYYLHLYFSKQDQLTRVAFGYVYP